MSSSKPYFITDESPVRLRRLLIRNQFLPTFYENLRTNRPLNDSIHGLSHDDPLIDFILQQLNFHELIEQTPSGYKVKYSKIVPPEQWSKEEHQEYVENVLANLKDALSKQPPEKMGFGNWTGTATEADFMAFAEQQIAAGNAFTEKPDGPVKYQFTFLLKQL